MSERIRISARRKSDSAHDVTGTNQASVPIKALRVVAGRELIFAFAHATEAASVVMDRNSGDYWLLTPDARSIVEAVRSGSVARGTAPLESGAGLSSSVDLTRTIQSLCDAGILESHAC